MSSQGTPPSAAGSATSPVTLVLPPTAGGGTGKNSSTTQDQKDNPGVLASDLYFTLTNANNHTLLNKWINIDESKHLALQSKEKKAHMTQQCRIIVKGAKHFSLQLSAGPTTEFLYPTWRYCRCLEEDGCFDGMNSYKEVEQFMMNHVKEVQQMLKQQHAETAGTGGYYSNDAKINALAGKRGSGIPLAQGQNMRNHDPEDSDSDSEGDMSDDEDDEYAHQQRGTPAAVRSPSPPHLAVPASGARSAGGSQEVSPRAEQPQEKHPHLSAAGRALSRAAHVVVPATNAGAKDTKKAIPANSGPGGTQASPHSASILQAHSGIFKLHVRPQTKEEWQNVDAIRLQVKRNRTILAMIVTVFYTAIMRYLSFDGYLLFLFFLECGVFYLGMNYKDLAKEMAKRGAKNRVNRVKDWFYFGVRRKDERPDAVQEQHEFEYE